MLKIVLVMPSQIPSTRITALSIKLDFVFASFENITLNFQQIFISLTSGYICAQWKVKRDKILVALKVV